MPNRQRAMGTALLLFHLFLPGAGAVSTPAWVSQDAMLSCHFDENQSRDVLVEWTLRTSPRPRVVYSYHQGSPLPEYQHPQFRGRAVVNESLLLHGDASLMLRNVSPFDEGTYRCIIRTPRIKLEQHQLLSVIASYTVPQVSCSQLEGQGYQDGAGVRLSCLSSGGYPSYELRWVWANGSQFTGQASATTRRQVADGTFWLQSVLEVDLSWGPHLRCVLSNLRLNRTSSGQTSCPAHPHRPAHNPFSGVCRDSV
ncbi:butyrophilin subfamily 1 member A1-like isoform X2 [Narcine bancroftii]|uniref:butyrophilin subfamily 1 member A1-like isoform X2 n=1 Tax=Narcine bancroftii TaxID=1343680 RepID=UPI0038310A1A